MKFTPLKPTLTVLTILTASALPSVGLQIRVFSPASHLRMNGFPANPTVNPTFLNPGGAASGLLDLSGVGWSVEDATKQFTLVSPRHFVGANHFRPGVGSTVRFLAKDNSLHTLTILKISAIANADNSPSDVFLGEFTTDMPGSAAVLPLPYLNLAAETNYVGQQLVIVGQAARGGRGIVGSVSDFGGDPLTGGAGIKTRAITFSYAQIGAVDDAFAQPGDSGSPSFAVRDDRAALVGTHTAVLSISGTTTTYDTLVPHYAPKLNLLMDATGLHLRKFDPPAMSLSASGAPTTATVRAASPFVLRLTVTNGAAVADNVTASLNVPAGFQISGFQAPGWFVTGPSTLRRGGLAVSESVQFDVSMMSPPADGTFTINLNLDSDGSVPQSFPLQLSILQSFASWANGLQDASVAGDSDGDGISNLIEYATGGNNQSSSVYFPGTEIPLTPVFSRAPLTLSFIRRTDAAARGLSYLIEKSDTLATGSWQTLGGIPISVTPGPGPGFEKAEATLPANGAAKSFYRLRVGLAE